MRLKVLLQNVCRSVFVIQYFLCICHFQLQLCKYAMERCKNVILQDSNTQLIKMFLAERAQRHSVELLDTSAFHRYYKIFRDIVDIFLKRREIRRWLLF